MPWLLLSSAGSGPAPEPGEHQAQQLLLQQHRELAQGKD
ncbi:hypothetical protein M2375_003229 [Comamonas sp. BIGb0152]|nr:hypothetical protein [Comamonas sp. BIGb0152]